jgi:hypothetical protein
LYHHTQAGAEWATPYQEIKALISGGYRRPRTRDPLVLIAVRYASGSSAYMRVTPEEAASPLLRKIAYDRQASGEIPEGEIAGVTKVR